MASFWEENQLVQTAKKKEKKKKEEETTTMLKEELMGLENRSVS
jgi:hypothetical protein